MVDGAADPFTRSSMVTSACFWYESGTFCEPDFTAEKPAAGTIRAWLIEEDASPSADCLTIVRPMTTSRSSHAVPLCIDTCSESPSMVAGPSSLASSERGNSSSISGSENGDVVLALKDKLHVTSGEET